MRFYLCLTFLFFIVASSTYTQELPRKLLKSYSGNQPAYSYEVKEKKIVVSKEPIRIIFEKETVVIEQFNNSDQLSYNVEAKTKDYFSISVRMKNGATENWRLYRKGKYIIRTAQFPRPETLLNKEKKKCFFRRNQ